MEESKRQLARQRGRVVELEESLDASEAALRMALESLDALDVSKDGRQIAQQQLEIEKLNTRLRELEAVSSATNSNCRD